LQWLYSNEGITVEDLANNILKPVEEIQSEIEAMTSMGLISKTDDVLTIEIDGINQLEESNVETEIVTRYTYEKAPMVSGGDLIPTSRNFCVRLIQLNRVYTRQDIDEISSIVGYNVWARRGGWMTVRGSSPAQHLPYCRHIWQPQLFRRKL
jgi:hypothetical protein